MWEPDGKGGFVMVRNRQSSRGERLVHGRERKKAFETDPHCRNCRRELTQEPGQPNSWIYFHATLCCSRCKATIARREKRRGTPCET